MVEGWINNVSHFENKQNAFMLHAAETRKLMKLTLARCKRTNPAQSYWEQSVSSPKNQQAGEKSTEMDYPSRRTCASEQTWVLLAVRFWHSACATGDNVCEMCMPQMKSLYKPFKKCSALNICATLLILTKRWETEHKLSSCKSPQQVTQDGGKEGKVWRNEWEEGGGEGGMVLESDGWLTFGTAVRR